VTKSDRTRSLQSLVLALLFGTSVVTYIDRVNISVTARQMMPAFGLTEQEMGWVFSAFVVGYASIAFLLRFLATHTLFVFVAYRVVLGVIVLTIQMPNGWFWTSRGTEFALMLFLVCCAFVIGGGGRYSLDRKLGKEF